MVEISSNLRRIAVAAFEALSPGLRSRFSTLASELAAHVDEIAERAIERIRSEVPEFAVDTPELAESVSSGARPSILAELVAMQQEATVPTECPTVDAEGARLAARFDVPLNTAIWVYRVGHKAQWETWYRLIGRAVRDGPDRVALHEAGSDFFFAYVDRISAWVTEEYTRERDLMMRDLEQRRTLLVRELLAGASPDPGLLDYPLEAEHLAVVASGPEARETLVALAHGLERRLLTVLAEHQTYWAWLASTRPQSSPLDEEVKATMRGIDATVAVGGRRSGVDGFRQSHAEAVAAHRVARVRGSGLTLYEDVALEVMALDDPDRARQFVHQQLGELAGSSPRAARLRETLIAYYASGHNAAATSARLEIHEQTVANRLSAVERLTGASVGRHRAELEMAIRLRALVDG
jgi:hypothetical protein